jgi:hypothetical protein
MGEREKYVYVYSWTRFDRIKGRPENVAAILAFEKVGAPGAPAFARVSNLTKDGAIGNFRSDSASVPFSRKL